ncbi:C40 family peptidase [uncultured Kocuria sp.]|uniref:C40 family peptidase n=1 Tax=uncultured Kocuria sp. TaxID=259305 RepID=UPI002626BD95|nr:NlpC/P60 family protein [uncultured Kocuria sp.]
MTRDLTSSNGIGSLLTGKARTVAAVAAFSGLALATTVSVQSAPAQDASADAPLSAVAAATPAAAPAVSLEPVAHVTKAEKSASEKPAAKKAEKKAERKVQTPVVSAPAVAAPAPKPAVQAAPAPKPAVQAAPAPKPAAAPAPAVAAPKPAAPKPAVQAAPAPNPVAAPKPVVQAAPAAERTVSTQSSASGKGATISSAAMGQLGVSQDCTALVTNALRAAGINHHGWPASYLSLGTQVSAGQAQPGDLVYYADGGMGAAHIGVYIGGGKAVHGGWNGGTTVIDSVNVGSGPVYVRVR